MLFAFSHILARVLKMVISLCTSSTEQSVDGGFTSVAVRVAVPVSSSLVAVSAV